MKEMQTLSPLPKANAENEQYVLRMGCSSS